MADLEIRRELAADAAQLVSLEVVTQASSPPRDGFAVANLNCPAWPPVRQPDGLVLWRACRSRRHGCPLDESGRMPELRGTLPPMRGRG